MRLHRLTVEAFGPFAEPVEVDFDELSQAGLFLVHGPTGSGKTSLLDAICFALYGSVPGARREVRSALRSHHAEPDVVPRVTLEFTASGRRLRIDRRPEFQRPKKRGTGTTKAQAKVVMTELVDGTWVDRGDGRHDDVAMIVDDVVGLGLAQFQTVVLLPQGDFASFLRADTTQRADVLAKLFDTGRFDDVQAWLEQRRRDTEAAVRDGRATLRIAVTRALEALAAVPPDAPTEAPVQATMELPGLDVALVPEPQAEAALVSAGLGAVVDSPDAEQVRAAVQAELVTLRSTLTATTHRAAGTRSALVQARRRREHGEAVSRMLVNAARARAALDALESEAPTVAAKRSRLAAAARAASVAGHLAAADSAARELARSGASVSTLPARLRDPEQAVTRGAELDANDEGVAVLLDLARRRTAATAALDGRLADLARHRESLAKATVTLDRAIARRDEQAAQLEAADAPARVEQAARRLVERLQSLVEAHEAVGVSRAAELAAEQSVAERAQATAVCAGKAAALGRARADSLAAELALTLEEGSPCPVCGGVEHPEPASPGAGGIVDADEVMAAEQSLADARAEQSRAEARLAAATATRTERQTTLERQVDRLLTDVDESDDPAAAVLTGIGRDELADRERADELAQAARVAHESALRAAATVERLRPLVEASTAQVEADGIRVSAAKEALAASQASVDSARLALASDDGDLLEALRRHRECPCMSAEPETGPGLRTRLDTAIGAVDEGKGGETSGDTSAVATLTREIPELVTSVVRHHQGETAAVAAAISAHAEAARARTAADEAQARLGTALAEADLDDETAAREALLTPADRAALQSVVDEHTERMARHQAVLQQEEVIAALSGPAPDLELLHAAEATAQAADRTASRQETLVRHAHEAFVAASGAIDESLDLLGPALAEAELARTVADTVAGTGPENTLRMSLTTYVLASRLAEVVRLANERLTVMTAGRYELRHSDALASHGRKSGLGLEVFDAWSGASRDTKTLSGGETFMASLALALGLGDAVRAESGGLELETLFVDEGFGTLDDTALEQVMEVLDGLRDGGRSVGIVSHVSELRTRIPAQVQLVRTPQGSSVRVLTCPEEA